MAGVHPTAIVERGAELGDGVSIGPYCIVGPDVRLGDGVTLMSHVVVAGRTRIGDNCRLFPFASQHKWNLDSQPRVDRGMRAR